MTNLEYIRQNLSIDMLVDIIEWQGGYDMDIPTCDEGCRYFTAGCAHKCPHERREQAVRAWLGKERP